jgi:CubicO group peptidase (beta-lactamase class C family)
MRGEVHDENAFALGGAAGHAGLFGSIDAVLDFARALMAGEVLAPETLAEMRRSHSATRALGWEIRHADWAGGLACSPDTIGHTGFTGTGLWIDWPRGIAWSLLANRVHPSRHVDTGIQALRRRVGERMIAAFDSSP